MAPKIEINSAHWYTGEVFQCPKCNGLVYEYTDGKHEYYNCKNCGFLQFKELTFVKYDETLGQK